MLSKREKQKILYKTCFLDTVKYLIIGAIISIVVGDSHDPVFGVLTFPVIVISAFLYMYFFEYRPNIIADEILMEWRGEEYFNDLQRELNTSSYGTLLKEDWFVKYMREKEKEDPPSVTKFMK